MVVENLPAIARQGCISDHPGTSPWRSIMSQAVTVAVAGVDREDRVGAPATVSLKGTTRGLEIHIAGAGTGPAAVEALGARLTELLAEAPGFFAGSDARVAFDGALPAGALACLEQVAVKFALNLVEIAPASQK